MGTKSRLDEKEGVEGTCGSDYKPVMSYMSGKRRVGRAPVLPAGFPLLPW